MPEGNVWLTADFSTFTVGDEGPAGGLIIYNKGSYGSGWQYIELAPYDQSESAQWYNTRPPLTTSTDYVIGTGKEATDTIIDAIGAEGVFAAQLCHNLIIDGYDDWFLPTTLEMFEALKICEALRTSQYWVSRYTEGYAEYVYWHSENRPISAGTPNYPFDFLRVRAARRF